MLRRSSFSEIATVLQNERIVFTIALCNSTIVDGSVASGGNTSMDDSITIEGVFQIQTSRWVVDEVMGSEYKSTNIAALISSK